MKRMIFALLLILSLSATGCVTKAKPAKTAAKPKSPVKSAAHSMKKSEERLLLKHAGQDLETIMAAGADAEALKSALAGPALKEMTARMAADTAAGKIKIRRYDKLELSPENYTKGIAGVAIVFTDNSYTADAATKKALDKPSGKRLKLLLALKKIEGRWVIIEIFSNEVKSPKAVAPAS